MKTLHRYMATTIWICLISFSISNATPVQEQKITWESMAKAMTPLMMSQSYEKGINLYEKHLAVLGEPSHYQEGYSEVLRYMSMFYGAIGQHDKMMEYATKALLAEELPEPGEEADLEAISYYKKLGEEAQKGLQQTKHIQNNTDNVNAKGEMRELTQRMGGVEHKEFDMEQFYEGYQKQDLFYSKSMIEGSLRNNQEYRNASATMQPLIFQKLAYNWGIDAIKEFGDPSKHQIPPTATFDEIYEFIKNIYTGIADQAMSAGIAMNDLSTEVANKPLQSTQDAISFYDSLIRHFETFNFFQADHKNAINQLLENPKTHQYSKETATEQVLTIVSEIETIKGKPLSNEKQEAFEEVLLNHLIMRDRFTEGYANLDPAVAKQLGISYQPNYLEMLREEMDNQIDAKGLQSLQHITHELKKAHMVLDIKMPGEINQLVLESEKMSAWATMREIMLHITVKSMEQDSIDLFDENSSQTYNSLLRSKDNDYKAKVFVQRGVYRSDDAALEKQYRELVRRKAGLTKAYMVPEKEQKKLDSNWVKTEIKAIQELQVALYEKITRAYDFSQFAKDYLITWEEIQSMLKPGEAFVDIQRVRPYSTIGRMIKQSDTLKYLFCIITPNHPPRAIVYSDDILAKEQNYSDKERKLFESKLSHDAVYQNTQPYMDFWAPLAKHVARAKKIYISPDGIYHQISLKSLQDPDGNYLASKHDIVKLAHVAELRKYKEKQSSEGSSEITLVGNPAYEAKTSSAQTSDVQRIYKGDFLDPLKNSLVEITQIDSLAKRLSIESSLFTETRASEDNFRKLRNQGIIHIATHGQYVDMPPIPNSSYLPYYKRKLIENPMMSSYLTLAGALLTLRGQQPEGENDGIISAEDISHLNLEGTQLAVLSACRTAQGKEYTGDGVFGLQRAFLIAGCQTVVTTLWAVDDKATMEFMTSFYTNLLSGNMDKREAFNTAQKEVREKYPHPRFWAPFVMIGV